MGAQTMKKMKQRSLLFIDSCLHFILKQSCRMSDNQRTWLMAVGMLLIAFATSFLAGKFPSFISIIIAFAISSAFLLSVPLLGGVIMQSRAEDLAHAPDLNQIRRLHWNAFEHFVGLVLKGEGYQVEQRGGDGPDGGIDLIATKDGRTYIVQCKHYQGERIGVALVRELLGVVYLNQADGCIFVTSGLFHYTTRDAFANMDDIHLWDGNDLVEKIHRQNNTLTIEQKNEICNAWTNQLMAAATNETAMSESAVINIPRCRTCGKLMHLVHKPTGTFWSCFDYPRCYGGAVPLGDMAIRHLTIT